MDTGSITSIKPLRRSFYERDTTVVAFELIGKILSFDQNEKTFQGRIVETEAYFGMSDPASHAYRGPTPRAKIMFGPPGFSYVYFTYGNHHCLNVVTEKETVAGAVLIRALEPLSEIEAMKQRRCVTEIKNLTNGPGKLTQAFGITRDDSGKDLTLDSFCVVKDEEEKPLAIQVTTRIGISRAKQKPYRFYLKTSPFVSCR